MPDTQLHVAALPFPSPQGTQAALRFMLASLQEAGHAVHLLCYPHGAGAAPEGIAVHRLWPLPPVRSLRSGPSVGKVLLDVQLAARLPGWLRRLRPARLVAHHVEAAAAVALGAPRWPFAFYAHTALGPELPHYLPRLPGSWPRRAGEELDRWLLRRARWRLAVSPRLAAELERLAGLPVRCVPPPWPLQPAAGAEQRAEARAALRLPPEAEVVLYAGNLDAYQGWEALLAAVARLAPRRPRLVLLVATASDPAPLRGAAARAGLGQRLRLAPLASEADRRAAHAAADVAAVPRAAPGGLPVKLLDAMARGMPVVAQRRAAAGFRLEHAVVLAEDRAPAALAAAIESVLRLDPERRVRLGRAARAHVAEEHAPSRFAGRLGAALASPTRAREAPRARPPARR